MQQTINTAAPDHLPPFITAPGETDLLMVIMIIVLVVMVVSIGVLYFRLHALPEHIASSGEKAQFEIVAVLALLALFTHNHIFWIAALLLAFVQLPDVVTPLSRMADALTAIARSRQLSAGSVPAAAAERMAPDAARERDRKTAAVKPKEKGYA